MRHTYEWHDDSGNWFRSYGNEHGEFAGDGLVARRFACTNGQPIADAERKFRWPLGQHRMTIRACRSWACNVTRPGQRMGRPQPHLLGRCAWQNAIGQSCRFVPQRQGLFSRRRLPASTQSASFRNSRQAQTVGKSLEVLRPLDRQPVPQLGNTKRGGQRQ